MMRLKELIEVGEEIYADDTDLFAVEKWLPSLSSSKLDLLQMQITEELRKRREKLERWKNAAKVNAQMAITYRAKDDASSEVKEEMARKQEALIRCRMRVIGGEKPRLEDYVPYLEGEEKSADPCMWVSDADVLLDK